MARVRPRLIVWATSSGKLIQVHLPQDTYLDLDETLRLMAELHAEEPEYLDLKAGSLITIAYI